QELHRVRAETAGTDDHGGRSGNELGEGALDRVVRGRARVGERADAPGVEVAHRHQLAARHDEVVRQSAVFAVATPAGAARAVVVLPTQAELAAPARVDARDGNRVSKLEVVDPVTELLHPTRALVPEGERQGPRDDARRGVEEEEVAVA